MSDRLSQADGRRSATALDIKSVLGIFWGGGITQATVGLIPSQASKPPPRTVTHQSALVRWKKILYFVYTLTNPRECTSESKLSLNIIKLWPIKSCPRYKKLSPISPTASYGHLVTRASPRSWGRLLIYFGAPSFFFLALRPF